MTSSPLTQWFEVFPKTNVSQAPTRKRCKLAFLVFGCATKDKYIEQLNACQETWGKEAETQGFPVYYVVGDPPQSPRSKQHTGTLIAFPGIGEDLPSVSYKHWWGLENILTKEVDADFLCICGTDTFPVIKNLVQLIDSLNPSSDIYIGARGGDRWVGEPVYFVNGGPCVIISRTVCNKLLPYCRAMPLFWKHYIEILYKQTNELVWSCDVTLAAILVCLKVKPIFMDGFYYHKNKCECEDCRKQLPPQNVFAYHFIEPTKMKELNDSFTNISLDR
jgi:hypothetical protein